MKSLLELLNESKTSTQEMRDYVKSWLRQDRGNYEATIDIILSAMINFFEEEIDYDKNDKSVQELYNKLSKIYYDWDELK